jgi:hypothetical protein
MIIQERFTLNTHEFIRTYSNEMRYVVRDGIAYSEANDPAEFNRTYIEGELMQTDDVATQTDYENALVEMGVQFDD